MKGNTNALPISVDRGEERVNLVLTLDGGDTDALYGASILITDADTGVSQILIYSAENANIFSITAGHRYTVDCKKYGQNLPPVIKEYTAINNYTRKLTLDYYTPPVGAYIYTTDNRCWTEEAYTGDGSDVVGIYIGDGSHRYIFNISNKSSVPLTNDINGLYEDDNFGNFYGNDDYENAILDFEGSYNTSRLVANNNDISSSYNFAWDQAVKFTFANGKTAYLPALGQMMMIKNNVGYILSLFQKIGKLTDGTQSSMYNYMISSTAGGNWDEEESGYFLVYTWCYSWGWKAEYTYQYKYCFVCCDFE